MTSDTFWTEIGAKLGRGEGFTGSKASRKPQDGAGAILGLALTDIENRSRRIESTISCGYLGDILTMLDLWGKIRLNRPKNVSRAKNP